MAQPVDVIILGKALNDFGFEAMKTIEGLGLNTFGQLWPCDGIWGPADPNVTTVWTNYLQPGGTVSTCTDPQ